MQRVIGFTLAHCLAEPSDCCIYSGLQIYLFTYLVAKRRKADDTDDKDSTAKTEASES